MAKINKDIAEKLANLPAEKRLLLFRKLEEQSRKIQPDAAAIPRQKRGTDTFPLSFAQQRLWFVDQLEPGNPAYNMFNAVRLHGPLDIDALAQGYKQVVQRHESLRTTFQATDGQPYQVIAANVQVDLPVRDLTGLPPAEREAEVQRLARAEAARPFDLAHGPLVRCSLLRVGESEHVLLLSMHHIISDGWSMGVLFREIILLAQAFAGGQPDPLPELPLQYPDFAVWQRDWLQGDVLETQLDYWKKQLAGAPAALELPVDKPRPALQTSHGARLRVTISREQSDALQALSRAEDVTLFMTLLAAFQTLLSRYSGQSDIVVGSPVAGRNRAELEGLVGLFANNLVLRTDLSGSPTFRESLRRVRETCLGAYNHQDVPFEKLVDELNVTRDLSRNPLFQVMLTLQNTPVNIPGLSGLRLEPLQVEPGTAQFELTLLLQETPHGLAGYFEYNTDLFEHETIDRMAGYFGQLLENMVAHPELPLSDLPMLGAAEQRQILLEWNATEAPLPPNECLHALFEGQAQRTPDATALIFGEQELTYQQLDRRANQLAHYLRSLGVGPDVLVGVCVERSAEMITGLLAILKAGGAYVPLDPNHPRERLGYILEDAGISLILSQKKLEPVLPAADHLQPVWLDQDWQNVIASQPETPPESRTDPSNLAYVLFTSGTTGRPKGVALEHRNAAALVAWTQATYSAQELSGMLASTSIGFDLSVYEIFGTLSLGGCLILAENVLQLPALPAAQRVTLVNTVPSAIAELLRQGGLPASVQTVNLAGEALPTQLVDKLYELPGVQRVIDAYGPTENTTYSTFAVRQAGAPATIGRPLPHWTVYILDSELRPVPAGVPGQLYIGGLGVARGYLNRPDLTAERFIPDPFSQTPGSRTYRTGDLGRWLPGGNIEYLGRLDHQVKLRGFRIELGEIESALVQHPGVREAVVVAREDQPGDKRLVAYIVPEGTPAPGIEELRNGLKTHLPEYMLPAAFVFLERFPLNPNGKIDRKALPVPDQQHVLTREYVAPRTPAEQALAAIWAEVLGLKQVGIHDNFFEAGGDSLQVMRVVARAYQSGFHFTPQDFFQNATIAQLAELAKKEQTMSQEDTPPEAVTDSQKTTSKSMRDLSPEKQALLAKRLKEKRQQPAAQANTEQGLVTGPVPLIPIVMHNYAYNAPQAWWRAFEAVVEVPHALGPARLKEVVQALVVHHDNLRLRLVKEDGGHRLFIAESEEKAFLERDLSGLPETEQDAAIKAAVEEQWASLDFSTGPTFRVVFFDLGSQHLPRLLIIMHHFALDGYSTGILLADFQTACQQMLAGEPIKLPPKTTSIKQWAERMYDYVHSDSARPEIAYWTSLPWPDLRPTPVDHPEVAQSPAARLTEFLSTDETQALVKKVPAAHNVQLLDVLLTACAITYAQYQQLKWFSISLLHHGRNPALEGIDLIRTVGNFYAPYPLFFNVSQVLDMGSPEKVLKLVAEQRARVPHGGAAWPWISYYSAEKSTAWQDKIDNVVLNYLGQVTLDGQNQSRMFRNVREPVKVEPAASPLYDLERITPHTCVPIIEGDRFKITWEYYSALDDKATIERLIGKYVEVLRALIGTAG